MRPLLAVILTFVIAFSAQINTLAGGAPVGLDVIGDYYVTAAGGMLYVFDSAGEIISYLTISALSDFAIIGDTIVVTTTSQDFPNVRAFTFPGLTPKWGFEPMMEIFDISLVWTDKQTRSWAVKSVSSGVGVASGYTLYVLSMDGSLVGNFTTGSDVWDFVENGGNYYLATQEGVIYVIDSNFELVEKLQACKDYQLIDRVSNRTIDTYPRSVWGINSHMAVCEDGNIFKLGSRETEEFRKYSDSQLYTYYYQTRMESGISSSMFENLKLVEDGDVSVVYSTDKFAVYKGTQMQWEMDTSASAVDIYNGEIYVLTVSLQGVEFLRRYSIETGDLISENEFKAISCNNPTYKMLAGEKTFIISNCEIKIVDTAVVWYVPRADGADFVEDGIFRVYYMDDEATQHNRAEFYSLLAMDGAETKWTYSLPNDLAREGKLNDVRILKGSGKIVALYSAGDDDRLIILDRENGTAIVMNASTRIYAGNLDEYLLNETIVEFAEDYNFDSLNAIPEEFKYGYNVDPDYWGTGNVLLWLQMMAELPVSVEVMDGLRDVMRDMSNYQLQTRIEAFDTCDYNGDGAEDIVVSSGSYITVIDGTTLEELLFKDSQTWMYDNNQINKNNISYFTASWFMNGGTALCFEDMSGDGYGELLISNYEGNLSMIFHQSSNLTQHWLKTYKNLHRERIKEIGDFNGDGKNDIMVSQWVEDRPDNVFILDARNGNQLFSFSPNQYFMRTAVDDVDGDGTNESIILYDQEGANLLVVSKDYRFEYSEFKDLWDTYNTYGHVDPAEIIPDMNGNGYKEIIVGVATRWGEPAMMLLIFDGGNQELLDRIIIEGEDEDINNLEQWQYIPEMKRFGDMVAFTIPAQERGAGSKLAVYNFVEGRMEAYVEEAIKKVVDYGADTFLIGTAGEIFTLSGEDIPEPEITFHGATVDISTNSDYYTNVYIDGILSASGRDDSFSMRIANGDHRVVISLQDKDGLQKLFTHEISTFTSSDLSFLNTIIVGLLLAFGGYKAARKWIWQ